MTFVAGPRIEYFLSTKNVNDWLIIFYDLIIDVGLRDQPLIPTASPSDGCKIYIYTQNG